MNKKTIEDIELSGKKVLVRCDFNVPQDENGEITDDRRIREALKTIKYLLDNNAKVISSNEDTIKLSVDVTNTGDRKAIEKVQAYAEYNDSRTITPHSQLCGIKSIELDKGETKTVEMEIDRYWIKAVLNDGKRVDPDGNIAIYVGGHQPDTVSDRLLGYACERVEIK